MGVTGPVPNRSDQRIRRNITEPIDKISALGTISVPDLGIADPHPIVADIYESMRRSAQRKFYEPTDWQYARLALMLVDKMLSGSRVSAQMVAAVDSMLTKLLLTEGDRRRVRIEVERGQNDNENVVQVADLFRERLSQL